MIACFNYQMFLSFYPALASPCLTVEVYSFGMVLLELLTAQPSGTPQLRRGPRADGFHLSTIARTGGCGTQTA